MSENPILYNKDSEEAVLGSCLLDGSAAPLKVGSLVADDFYLEAHRILYDAIGELFERDGDLDFLVLTDYLDGKGVLAEIGGAAYVHDLINQTPTALHVAHYARIVRRDGDRRRFLAIAMKMARIVHEETDDDVTPLYDRAFKLLQAAYPAPLSEAAPATWADLDRAIGPIEWSWPDWIARGFLTMLASEPGEGKSILGLHLCAIYLGARALWPDSQPYTGEAGSILWCEAEAAQSLNLQRAKSWGLPIERMLYPFADPMHDLKLDDPAHRRALDQVARRDDVRFIVVDSLSGASGKDENSSETLSTVHWLAELARDTAKPVLLIHHLRKRGLFDGGDRVTLDRLRGYSGIVQPARVVMVLDTPDEQDAETKRLSVIKSNLGRFPEPLGLQITEQGIIFCSAPTAGKQTGVLEQAKEALRALLEDGPQFYNDLEAELKAMGVSMSTARRAKRDLGIVSKRIPSVGWRWALPSQEEASPG